MGDISRSLGIYGAGYTAKIGERELTFTPITERMKGDFAQRIVERERDEAMNCAVALRGRARELRRAALAKVEKAEGDGTTIAEEELEDLQAQIEGLERQADLQLRDFRDQKAAGKYHYREEVCQAALKTTEGTVHMVWMMLRQKHPDVTIADVDTMVDSFPREVKDAVYEAQNLGKPKKEGRGKDSAAPSSAPPDDPSTTTPS